MNAPLSLSSAVVLTPLRAAVCADRDNTVDVLVRIQAPQAPAGHAAQRPAQALALVIDRSGSMAGRPLAEAKRCAQYVMGQLRPDDCVSLVSFDNRVRRLWPAVRLGDGAAQRFALESIREGGNTDLHGGWKEGARTLTDVTGQGLKRVILLSDGQANEGVTDSAEMAAACAHWAAQGITTSTYGLGRDFNEQLMVAMARAGGGNHYYGDTADDLMEPFQQELELLANLCLRDLRLAVTVPEGCTAEMVNPLPPVQGGWRLPDLAWGAEAWAVVRVRLPAAAVRAQGSPCAVLRVSVSGQSMEGEAVSLERTGLALPVVSEESFSQTTEDALVARRSAELAAAALLLEMRDAAAINNWDQVEALLAAAVERFAANPWLAAMLDAMRTIAKSREQRLAMKEMLYSSSKLSSRLAAQMEDLNFSASDQDAVPAFLRRKPEQGKGQGKP